VENVELPRPSPTGRWGPWTLPFSDGPRVSLSGVRVGSGETREDFQRCVREPSTCAAPSPVAPALASRQRDGPIKTFWMGFTLSVSAVVDVVVVVSCDEDDDAAGSAVRRLYESGIGCGGCGCCCAVAVGRPSRGLIFERNVAGWADPSYPCGAWIRSQERLRGRCRRSSMGNHTPRKSTRRPLTTRSLPRRRR
jgi:hypothetical protein